MFKLSQKAGHVGVVAKFTFFLGGTYVVTNLGHFMLPYRDAKVLPRSGHIGNIINMAWQNTIPSSRQSHVVVL